MITICTTLFMHLSTFFSMLFVGLAVAATASILISSLFLGISPTPSSAKARAILLAWSQQHIPPTGDILECGAGWGSLAFPLAKQHPTRQVIAIEVSFVPWLWMVLRNKLTHHPNLTIIKGNFLAYPMDDVGLITCYLFTGGMKQLAPKIQAETRPGTCILSNTFSLPGWKEEQIQVLPDLYKTRLYRYKTGHDQT